MSDPGWRDYVKNTKGAPPRPLTLRALPFVQTRHTALDLGAGALNDTIHLLGQGFQQVIALDKHPVARHIAETLPSARFRYVIAAMEDHGYEPADFITAQYSLPFIPPAHFVSTFAAITAALRPGAILAATLFGDRDAWAGAEHMTFHTAAQARALAAPLETLHFDEEEADRPTAAGDMKHWHLFHLIGRKPAP